MIKVVPTRNNNAEIRCRMQKVESSEIRLTRLGVSGIRFPHQINIDGQGYSRKDKRYGRQMQSAEGGNWSNGGIDCFFFDF